MPPHQSDVIPVDSTCHLLKCPNEQLMMIVGSVDMATGAALARTCKRLQSLIEPILYRYNIRRQGGWAMGWAAVHGQIRTLKKAVARGGDVRRKYPSVRSDRRRLSARYPLLHYAAKHGRDNIVEFILDSPFPIDIDQTASGLCGCKEGFEPNYWKRDCDWPSVGSYFNDECAAMHLAFCHGNMSTARLLLRRGATPEEDRPHQRKIDHTRGR